jgi:hypothetical protein
VGSMKLDAASCLTKSANATTLLRRSMGPNLPTRPKPRPSLVLSGSTFNEFWATAAETSHRPLGCWGFIDDRFPCECAEQRPGPKFLALSRAATRSIESYKGDVRFRTRPATALQSDRDDVLIGVCGKGAWPAGNWNLPLCEFAAR